MRILSQDGIGIIDLPYEQVGISIHFQNKKEIIAYPAGAYTPDDNYWTMARYSSESKAKKAMEMLRDAYGARFMYKTMTEQQKGLFLMTLSEKEKENVCAVFQFPSDEELEV